jgi:hypothetical protein
VLLGLVDRSHLRGRILLPPKRPNPRTAARRVQARLGGGGPSTAVGAAATGVKGVAGAVWRQHQRLVAHGHILHEEKEKGLGMFKSLRILTV